MKDILEFIIRSIGFWIIWHLIIRNNKKFTLYSKEGFITFILIVFAVTLIKINL